MADLTFDGRKLTVPAGTNLVDAGAAEPVKGLYQHFRPLLEEHIRHGGCPIRTRSGREVAHA